MYRFSSRFSRSFSAAAAAGAKKPRVAVLGAAGGIGQPLSLLLKVNPRVGALSLYDVANVYGVAEDLHHIDTPPTVQGFTGPAELNASLKDADIVLIPAGVPRKPNMTRDQLFETNAGIVFDLAAACAQVCPKALVLIIANPVNSTVPIVREVYRHFKVADAPSRVLGVTTLDVVRANTFSALAMKTPLSGKDVMVIGGHAGETILPLFSQVPGCNFDGAKRDELLKNVQFGGDAVVAKKAGTGSATLSMAYAADKFVSQILSRSTADLVAYVDVTSSPFSKKHNISYFSLPLTITPNGVTAINADKATLSPFEEQKFNAMLPQLRESIEKGVKWAQARVAKM